MVPSQFRVDIFGEMERILNQKVEPIIISPVYEEAQRLAERSRVMGKKVSLVLRVVKEGKVIEIDRMEGETTDDLIIRLAREWSCPVATNDRRLRRRLREVGVPVIFLRQRRHLEVDGLRI